jgi:hypothetical protein
MSHVSAIPLLLSLLAGLALGAVTGGALRLARCKDDTGSVGHDGMLLGLLALAAFALGAFVTYLLLGVGV